MTSSTNTDKLKIFQRIAIDRGGKCLSSEYVDCKTKLEFECREGHQWSARPDSVKGYGKTKGTWCKKCEMNSRKLSLSDLKKIAKDRGGKCRSKKYVDAHTDLEWECAEGHQWSAPAARIKGSAKTKGTWCPTCGGNEKLTIEKMRALAKKNGGECLSEEYTNNATHLDWRCANGHEWSAVPASVIAGSWCEICSRVEGGLKRRIKIEELKAIAKARNGECLSESCSGKNDILQWRCEQGHEWPASAGSVKHGRSWCPDCNRLKNLSEEFCRHVFQSIFEAEFPNLKPSWNIGPKGKLLEIDGLNEGLKIGFEHHGKHHNEIDGFFIRNEKQLREHIARDERKRSNCVEHGINLFEINQISISELEKALDQILDVISGIVPPLSIERKAEIISTFDSGLEKRFKKLQQTARERGGELISTTYGGSLTKHWWQCSEGHQWEATPHAVLGSDKRKGTWCKICSRKKAADKRRSSLEEMQKVAAAKGGKCLSTTYKNNNTPLLWECSEGHQWKATAASVKGTKKSPGTWCDDCAKKIYGDYHRGTIEEMKAIAIERGGECLSDTYVNSATKLEWRCKRGHTWKATPSSVKGSKNTPGSWCGDCYSIDKRGRRGKQSN